MYSNRPKGWTFKPGKKHICICSFFSNLSFEFIFNYIRTISIDISLKSPSTKRAWAHNFSPICVDSWPPLMSDDGQQWSLLGGLCGQRGVQCLCGWGAGHWTMRKKITAGEITRGQGERWVHNFVQSDLCWQEATNNVQQWALFGVLRNFQLFRGFAARGWPPARFNSWSQQHYSVKL